MAIDVASLTHEQRELILGLASALEAAEAKAMELNTSGIDAMQIIGHVQMAMAILDTNSDVYRPFTDPDDDQEWGEDPAQEALERGPR